MYIKVQDVAKLDYYVTEYGIYAIIHAVHDLFSEHEDDEASRKLKEWLEKHSCNHQRAEASKKLAEYNEEYSSFRDIAMALHFIVSKQIEIWWQEKVLANNLRDLREILWDYADLIDNGR